MQNDFVKQSFKFSLVNYAGLVIAILAGLIVYPLDFATYGIFQFLLSLSHLLIPILTLGTSKTIIKYYPVYIRANRSGELIAFNILVVCLVSMLFLLIFPFIYPFLSFWLSTLGFDVLKIDTYKSEIFSIALASSFMLLFSAYITNFGKIVIPTILSELSNKLV